MLLTVATCSSLLGWVEALMRGRQPIRHYREKPQHFCPNARPQQAFTPLGAVAGPVPPPRPVHDWLSQLAIQEVFGVRVISLPSGSSNRVNNTPLLPNPQTMAMLLIKNLLTHLKTDFVHHVMAHFFSNVD